MTPFRATKGTVYEGGFRVPAIIRWPGKVKPGSVENGIFSGLDWLPTLTAAAGNPDITDQLLKGVKLGRGESLNDMGGGYLNDFMAREFWRFVVVQQQVAKLAETAIDYPPMQAPATFNLDAVKRAIEEAIKAHEGQ